jgi:hypothetical protein
MEWVGRRALTIRDDRRGPSRVGDGGEVNYERASESAPREQEGRGRTEELAVRVGCMLLVQQAKFVPEICARTRERERGAGRNVRKGRNQTHTWRRPPTRWTDRRTSAGIGLDARPTRASP